MKEQSASLWIKLCLTILLSVQPMRCFAQAHFNKSEPTDTTSESSFITRLNDLAVKHHIAFVVEGELPTKDIPISPAKSLYNKPDFSDELKQIVQSSDYSVEFFSKSICLLRKNYTDVDELPFISIEECDNATRNILLLLAAFVPKESPQTTLKEFAAHLSADQFSLLTKEGVPISQLPSTQRELLWKLCVGSYTRGANRKSSQARNQIQCVLNEQSTVGFAESKALPKRRLFGYSGVLSEAERINSSPSGPFINYFRPLSNAPAVWSNADGSILVQLVHQSAASDANPDTKNDLTEPEVSPKSVQTRTNGKLPYSLRTLGDVINNLKSASVTVENSISSKPLIVLNPEAADGVSLLRASAKLYDLTVKTDPMGSMSVTYKRAPKIASINDLTGALQQVIPSSFLRAVHWYRNFQIETQAREADAQIQELERVLKGKENLNEEKRAVMLGQIAELEKIRAASSNQRTSQNTASDFARRVRIAAVKRLRGVVEPVLKEKKVEQIPISICGTVERNAIGVVLMSDLWAAVQHNLSSMPDYIDRFDDTILTGGAGEFSVPTSSASQQVTKRPGMSLTLNYRNKDGELIWSGVTYTSFESINPETQSKKP